VEEVTGPEARGHIDQLSQKYHGRDYDPAWLAKATNLPPSEAQRWAEDAAGRLPNGRLRVIPGAAHAINYGAPLELVRVAAPFLREASATQRTDAELGRPGVPDSIPRSAPHGNA
jgi:hypothetical protein